MRGVWITARHPVISDGRWVNPCELAATAPWWKRRHVMPDMFTFELEGHDDTIILSGGEGDPLLVSCTLGKDLGDGHPRDVWTRRSTRCSAACIQCDAVVIPGMRFDHGMDPSLRSATFPAFPQVEWETAEASEFALERELVTAGPLSPKIVCDEPGFSLKLLSSGVGAPAQNSDCAAAGAA